MRKLRRADCISEMSAEGIIPVMSPTKYGMMVLAAVKRDLPGQKLSSALGGAFQWRVI